MRLCLLACLLLLAVVGAVPKRHRMGRLGLLSPPPSVSRTNTTVTTANFTQQLDHFEPTNNATWNQLYFETSKYYKKGGPVFIFIYGEGPADATWMSYGAWIEYAQRYNALLFQLEHRYYGKSHPTSDMSDENLVYLSSEQAVADVATFVEGMNTKYQLPQGTKWVAFGGSYAGNLAAWARYKYPHLIHAAVSSSGPVLAKVDFFEYMNVVRNSLGTYGKSCPKAVVQANQQLLQKLKTAKGRKQITSIFNLCTPLNTSNQMDEYNLLFDLAVSIAVIVQHNNQAGPEYTINNLCHIMTNKSMGSLLQRWAAVTQLIYGSTCLDYSYDEYVDQYRQTAWDDTAVGGRMWMYQTCTEFGFYQTSEKKQELFGSDLPLDYYLQQCIDIFGKNFSKKEVSNAVYRTNTMYGGLDLKATRVVYVQGSIDPWHALGITKTRIPESPAILIKGTAHCANMFPPQSDDPAPLKAARKKISSLIGKWLKEK